MVNREEANMQFQFEDKASRDRLTSRQVKAGQVKSGQVKSRLGNSRKFKSGQVSFTWDSSVALLSPTCFT